MTLHRLPTTFPEEPVDIADPLRQLCDRLQLEYDHVIRLEFRPGDVAAEFFPHGRKTIDPETGEMNTVTRTYRVKT